MDSILFDAAFVICDAAKTDALSRTTSNSIRQNRSRARAASSRLVQAAHRIMSPATEDTPRARRWKPARVPHQGFRCRAGGWCNDSSAWCPHYTVARFVKLCRRKTAGWIIPRVLSFDTFLRAPIRIPPDPVDTVRCGAVADAPLERSTLPAAEVIGRSLSMSPLPSRNRRPRDRHPLRVRSRCPSPVST